MLRTLAKSSLRRCVHTAASRTPHSARPTRLHAALTASAALTTYFVWSTWRSPAIALDAASDAPNTPASAADVAPSKRAPRPKRSGADSPFLEDVPAETETVTEAETETAVTAATTTDTDTEPGSEQPADASGGGAFNPVTGEINWDCPCLGGMAYGVCGAQFREAFSCFVFSEQEPKGIDCVERFKNMQDCFREHPDVYGDDIMDEDEDEDGAAAPAGDVPPSDDEPVPEQVVVDAPFAPSPLSQEDKLHAVPEAVAST